MWPLLANPGPEVGFLRVYHKNLVQTLVLSSWLLPSVAPLTPMSKSASGSRAQAKLSVFPPNPCFSEKNF